MIKMGKVCHQNTAMQWYLTSREPKKGDYLPFDDNKQKGATLKEQQEGEKANSPIQGALDDATMKETLP